MHDWQRGLAYVAGSMGLHLIAWWLAFGPPLQLEADDEPAGVATVAEPPVVVAPVALTPLRFSILAATAQWFEADTTPEAAPPPPPAPPPPAPVPSASASAAPDSRATAGGSGSGKPARRPGGPFHAIPLKDKSGHELAVPRGDNWCIEVQGRFIAGNEHQPLTAKGHPELTLGGHAKWSTLVCQRRKCEAYTNPMPVKSGSVRVKINDNHFEDNEGDIRARYVACPRSRAPSK